MLELPETLTDPIDTSVPEAEAHSINLRSLVTYFPEGGASYFSMAARTVDHMEAVDEYLDRIEPVFRCCMENEIWSVPGGVVKIVRHIEALLTDTAVQIKSWESQGASFPREISTGVLRNLPTRIAELFDGPIEGNSLLSEDDMKRFRNEEFANIRRGVKAVRDTLASYIAPYVKSSD